VSIADTVRSGDLVVQEACEHVLLSFMRKPSQQALEMASVSEWYGEVIRKLD